MVQHILKGYLRRLTNLSGNNRSLFLLRLISDQFIDLHDFDFALNEPSFHILEKLMGQKNAIPLCDILDSRDGSTNTLSRRLKKLKRIEKFIYEERGARDLYVGWPFVRGKFIDGTPIRCPLLFFPVSLEEVNNQWVLKPRKSVNLTFNKTFLLAYSFFNKVSLDENLVERVFDDFDKDSKVFRTELYDLLKESSIEINFNQDNFKNALLAFANFRKTEFEKQHDTGELKLYPEAALGIFPQAGSYLVPDYVRLLEQDDINNLEEFFTSRTIDKDEIDLSRHSEAFRFLQKVKEEQTYTPFDLDAYQENALKAVKKGNSVVVQGPPGTGKSQLICNLISDFIARGKNVLVVCQKKAALDVVFDRLREIDLQDFIGLMHDFKNDRKNIYEKMASQIERLDDYQHKNNSLDAIQLERQFLQASRKIDQLSEELEEFKYALYDESECGLSVKELYMTSDIHKPAITMKQEYKDFQFREERQFLKRLNRYALYAERYQKEDYPLIDRKSFADFGVTEFHALKQAINEIPGFQQRISQATEELTNQPITLPEAEKILERKPKVEELLAILKDKNVYPYFRHMVEMDIDPDPAWLEEMERVVMQCYRDAGPELSLPTSELGKFQEVLERAIEARRGPISWLRWKLFSKDKIFVTRVIIANGLRNNTEGFDSLVARIDNRLNLEHNLSKLKGVKWLKDFPSQLRKVEVQNWFYFQRQAVSAKLIFSSLRTFKELLPVKKMFYEELYERFNKILTIYQDIPSKMTQWKAYLSTKQIEILCAKPEYSDVYQKTLQKDFDALCEFDKLKESFSHTEHKIVDKLMDHVQPVNAGKIIDLFENSLRLAWIDHIETKYPLLRAVSSQKLDQLEEELQDAVQEKMAISNEILLMRAREGTYRDVEYNRLNNLVTYRDLHHQVTKKRRVWPVRKLIKQFPDEVFSLIPCWMASPESASAIFQMEEIFDLVIFDEASQCFAEKGIPAMYRAKQVVITGDDKQLQPNDLYKVRWEDDSDEDTPELEVDSLLNLADKYLMQLHLRGHYRSKTLELIEFSNQYFYQRKLRLLPDPTVVNSGEKSIEYIKVDGIWEDNTNDDEANEVVSLVQTILKSAPEKEIGIVTFNAKQQGLILDKLEEEFISQNTPIPDTLFVKNIENVQGDEKDVIIFSTAYAPDKKGKLNLRFGPLNVEGGENRLNVAITRAREKIYIVSSIMPQQLHVDDTKNIGPKLLKKYLEYAYNVSNGTFMMPESVAYQQGKKWYLSEVIKSQGQQDPHIQLSRELPFADLTVRIDDQYAGLILTDDQLYHDAISVKEVHVYKPMTLTRKNWRFKTFYSREQWLKPDETKEKLNIFLSSLS